MSDESEAEIGPANPTRRVPWPRVDANPGPGGCMWFDDKGMGPGFPGWEVRVNNTFPRDEMVGLRFPGIGGPFFYPEEAERVAAALIEAAKQVRALANEYHCPHCQGPPPDIGAKVLPSRVCHCATWTQPTPGAPPAEGA